jgi:hypothetical protein
VKGARHKLFTRAGLPHNEHGRIRGSNLLDSVQHISQRFALTDYIFKVVFQFDFILQVGAFGFQLIFQLFDLRVALPQTFFRMLSGSDVGYGT